MGNTHKEDGSDQRTESSSDGEQQAMSYVLGMMSPTEASIFEGEVSTNKVGQETLEEIRLGLDALTLIAEGLSEATPAPRKVLKSKIMSAIALEAPQQEQAAPTSGASQQDAGGLERHVIRKDDGQWQESGMPGITLKLLHQIPDASAPGHSRYSVLVRLAKGAEYPHHQHVGYEECLVIEGDIHVNDVLLKAGDFILTDDRTEHVRTWSDEGCLLLLSTMLEDKVM